MFGLDNQQIILETDSVFQKPKNRHNSNSSSSSRINISNSSININMHHLRRSSRSDIVLQSNENNLKYFDDIFDGVFREVSARHVRELLLHAQFYMSEGDWCTAKSACQQALERSTDPKDARKIQLLLKEVGLFQERSIQNLEQPPTGELNWAAIHGRGVEKVFENHHDMPQSLFFLRYEERGVLGMRGEVHVTSCYVRFVVGRRLLSHQFREGRISELHCSLITASMILGTLEDQRMREDGVVVYFRPMKADEKLLFMHQLLEKDALRMTEIVFPFPVLHPESKKELSCPEDGWQICESLADQLEEGEEILREYSVEFLKGLGQRDLTLFDPACSNGQFLQHLGLALPGCRTLGQDLSPKMVSYAARRLDQVFCGDCRQPAVGENSVDVAFCRFLNSEIVKTADVMDLLLPVSRCVKVGGHLVIFGHTPVLLSAAELRSLSGWSLLSCVAGGSRWNGLFQYYVCQRLE